MRAKKIMSFALTLCLVMSMLIPMFSFTSSAINDGPDLIFTKAAITSQGSDVIGFRYTIENVGTTTISSLYNVSIQCFFSDNTIFNDSGDVAAGGSILAVSRSLAPGESYTGTFGGYGAVPPGKHYLVFKIDWGGIVSELDENNNTYYLQTDSFYPVVFRDINYSGDYVTLAPGYYNLTQLESLGVLNDDISSIIIPSGYTVYLCEHDNFQGNYIVLTSSNANFCDLNFNDTVSSIIIV